MKKILFVCLGNICRSPMAEFMLKDIVKNKGIDNKFFIESRATSYDEENNPMHPKAINKLKEHGICITNKRAQRIQKDDYNNFDFIIGMENSNIRAINNIIGNDRENKVYRLLDFTTNPRDIADPWYTGDFDTTYCDIKEGLEGFLKYLGY